MNFSGLVDSIIALAGESAPCSQCGGIARLENGLCLTCLIQVGLEPATVGSANTLEELLAEIDLRDGDWRIGNYDVMEEIGRGGMGVIYKARDRQSRRIVALKRVLDYHADSAETVARFRREAEAVASLDHPNILPIYEVGDFEGLPFFTMKLATGGSLQSVRRILRDDPRHCVWLLARVARAVQHAHGQGILHRDLKPGNILLDGWREPLVSDFGLAKWLHASTDLTRTLTIFGTPGYIAPEQAGGPSAGLRPAADIYSLGAILFDLVAGRPPFLGEHALAVMRQAADEAAPKLRTIAPALDRDLETICAKCLERDPQARYQSAGDLAEDLERWLDGRSIVARPVLPPVMLWRWSKRNPWLAGSVAACALLLALGLSRQIETTQLTRTMRHDRMLQHSVVVLPFLDLDEDAPDRVLAERIATSLQAALSAFGPARVVPTAISESVFQAGSVADVQEASRTEGVRAVLAGTVRARQGTSRINLRLMDGRTGDVLLRQSIEIGEDNLGAAEVARSTAAQINRLLALRDWSEASAAKPDPAMQNPQTREILLAGDELKSRVTVADLELANKCYEKVLAIEPSSALAHARRSVALGILNHFAPADGLLETAEVEAQNALRLDPHLLEAHQSLGGIYLQEGKLAEALEQGLKNIELGGQHPGVAAVICQAYRLLGRSDRALRWEQMGAFWQRPRPSEFDAGMGDCWTDMGDDERAANAYARANDVHPDRPDGWIGLCRLRLLQRDFPAARDLARQHLSAYGPSGLPAQMIAQVEFFARDYAAAEKLYTNLAQCDPDGGSTGYGALTYSSVLGHLRVWAGDESGGRAQLEEALAKENALLRKTPRNSKVLYRIAALESSLGNTQSSLSHLQAAVEGGWIDHRSMVLDPRLDHIAETPLFREIVANLIHKTDAMRLASQNNNH